MSDISVVIGTFGDSSWERLAEERAIPSAENQTLDVQVVHVHAATLHEARNEGASKAGGRYLIFLDADDELSPTYAEKMLEAAETSWARSDHQHFLYQPATLGVVEGREDPFPVLIERKPLLDGNFMVIGTMLDQKLFMKVGGFHDWPLYEDWDLWIRCWREGAGFFPVPDAIYRVHVRDGSRNEPGRSEQIRIYNAIRRQYA